MFALTQTMIRAAHFQLNKNNEVSPELESIFINIPFTQELSKKKLLKALDEMLEARQDRDETIHFTPARSNQIALALVEACFKKNVTTDSGQHTLAKKIIKAAERRVAKTEKVSKNVH